MPTVLITGANRGLGLEMARQYAGAGWRVHAACRAPDATNSGVLDPLFAGKSLAGPPPGVFICEKFACRQPVFGRAAAIAAWDELAKRPSAP